MENQSERLNGSDVFAKNKDNRTRVALPARLRREREKLGMEQMKQIYTDRIGGCRAWRRQPGQRRIVVKS